MYNKSKMTVNFRKVAFIFLIMSVLVSQLQFNAMGITYDWNGTWVTGEEGRDYKFVQSGNTVTGSVSNTPDFKFEGTVDGKTLKGKWSIPPASQPDYAGDMEITMSDDGQTIDGRWKFGSGPAADDSVWFTFSCMRQTAAVRVANASAEEANTVANDFANADSAANNKTTMELIVGNPKMKLNGKEVEIDPGRGTKPLIISSRTLVPIRSIVEALGGTVKWEATEKKVTIIQDDKKIDLWIDKYDVNINGTPSEMDVTPLVINGRTVLPLRFVSENLGCKVEWNGNEQKITLTN